MNVAKSRQITAAFAAVAGAFVLAPTGRAAAQPAICLANPAAMADPECAHDAEGHARAPRT